MLSGASGCEAFERTSAHEAREIPQLLCDTWEQIVECDHATEVPGVIDDRCATYCACRERLDRLSDLEVQGKDKRVGCHHVTDRQAIKIGGAAQLTAHNVAVGHDANRAVRWTAFDDDECADVLTAHLAGGLGERFIAKGGARTRGIHVQDSHLDDSWLRRLLRTLRRSIARSHPH